MRKIYKYETPGDVAAGFAGYMHKLIEESDKKQFHIALSGGSTPKILFNHLAVNFREKTDWGKVHFWWGDERMVPPDHAESNYRMTKENLLSFIDIPEGNIHRIQGEEEPEKEAARYGSEIMKFVPFYDNLPRFDLIILGMGEDGHTASIFPGQMQLMESAKICEVAMHPVTGQKRVTLTGRVINNAVTVAFLVTGKGKAEKTGEILSGAESAQLYPAAHIKPAGILCWFLDKFALKY